MDLEDRFGLLEHIATTIYTDLREVDPDDMDEESRDYLSEAYSLSGVMEDVLLDNITWEEAREKFVEIHYGELQ